MLTYLERSGPIARRVRLSEPGTLKETREGRADAFYLLPRSGLITLSEGLDQLRMFDEEIDLRQRGRLEWSPKEANPDTPMRARGETVVFISQVRVSSYVLCR